MTSTPLWTVGYTETEHGEPETAVAVVAACDRADAERRACDVLGADAVVVWVEPRHGTALLV